MAEPAGKRLKSSLPLCRAHRSSGGSRARHNLQAAVEEALCGVSSLLWDGAYRLKALASVFERDDVALPWVASFFHQEALKQEEEAEAMMGYLAERGGNFCNKDIQKPGCEVVLAVLPALELLMLQLKEEADVLVALSQLARHHGDPHTASFVKSHFLSPRTDRLKLIGDLLTSARRLGCTNDQTAGGFGEYMLNELQDELTR
ncbi:ferritin light chain, oocyte isoform-like [Labrus mixtus]|uniref:ferritin light chain, oocyte isoform-like n=1 Tax=Labrus mixtus TaxID=508554 RepID=UPI0029C0AC76|nr:ferritin light chain, oocyte isoform-like [Labrus mixtus]XP_060893088.1 ferritin light chain, oocyte isoform-like [Labrus mixtus]